MERVYSGQFYEIDHDANVVRLRRTEVPLLEVAGIESALSDVLAAVDAARDAGASVLLVDMRDAKPRNDPTFESVARKFRATLHVRFDRVAVLVKTQAGRLQLARLNREQDLPTGVFDDETEALRYLSAVIH